MQRIVDGAITEQLSYRVCQVGLLLIYKESQSKVYIEFLSA